MSDFQGGVQLGGSDKSITDLEDVGVEIHLHDLEEEDIWYTDREGNKHAVTMTVAGTFSKRYRKAEATMQTRRIKRRRIRITGEQLMDDTETLTASCVIGWSGFFDQHGHPIECNKTNVRRVFERFPHIRQQVQVAMEDHETFFKASSKT